MRWPLKILHSHRSTTCISRYSSVEGAQESTAGHRLAPKPAGLNQEDTRLRRHLLLAYRWERTLLANHGALRLEEQGEAGYARQWARAGHGVVLCKYG
jgi:hypothetical protein